MPHIPGTPPQSKNNTVNPSACRCSWARQKKAPGMRTNENSITRLLIRLWAQLRHQPSGQNIAPDLPPLRAELFSADQMEQHGKALAESHSLHEGSASDRLLQRLKDNEVTLVRTCNLLTAAVKNNHRITPAGE